MFNLYRVTSAYGKFAEDDFIIAKGTSMSFGLKWCRDGNYVESVVEASRTPYEYEFIASVSFTEDLFARMIELVIDGTLIPVQAWEKMLFKFDAEDDAIFNMLNNY